MLGGLGGLLFDGTILGFSLVCSPVASLLIEVLPGVIFADLKKVNGAIVASFLKSRLAAAKLTNKNDAELDLLYTSLNSPKQ